MNGLCIPVLGWIERKEIERRRIIQIALFDSKLSPAATTRDEKGPIFRKASGTSQGQWRRLSFAGNIRKRVNHA